MIKDWMLVVFVIVVSLLGGWFLLDWYRVYIGTASLAWWATILSTVMLAIVVGTMTMITFDVLQSGFAGSLAEGTWKYVPVIWLFFGSFLSYWYFIAHVAYFQDWELVNGAVLGLFGSFALVAVWGGIFSISGIWGDDLDPYDIDPVDHGTPNDVGHEPEVNVEMVPAEPRTISNILEFIKNKDKRNPL